ncbi:MAG TPA: GWxTD domain-containing protein [Candidatus Polarisedimenticolia bacterium]|nr:GWxTD domain-containing protein [Candidatus Polarisedimenticolia bacterium]
MALVRRLIVTVGVAALSALPSLPSFRATDWALSGNAAERGWARGPVWYIMTHSEYGAYRRLKSDSERRGFIRSFWQRRDPLPDTPDNELEREFWRRVNTVDGHFGQEVKPGWKTERGKVYIMLGPPDNVEEDGILFDRWAASRWTYDLGGLSPSLRVVLVDALGIPPDRRVVKLKVREETEGARSVDHGMPVQASVLRPTESLPLAESLVRRFPGPDSLRSLGQVMRVPETMEPPATVHVSTVFSHVPIRARVDFKPGLASASRPRTAVAVTVGVRWSDLERAGITSFQPSHALLTGHLTSLSGDKARHRIAGVFSPERELAGSGSGEIVHTFQAVANVPPGRYALDVSYQDVEDRVMGSVHEEINVPAFEQDGLTVSTMVLASRLDWIEGAPEEGRVDAPFTYGAYRVVPRTSSSFRPAEQLTVFYRVYGARPSTDGRPALDITYQFYVEDGPRWLPVGAPIALSGVADAEQAWGVPLEGWPAGRYRLEATVVDRLSDEAAVRGLFFEIVPAGAGPTLR